MLFCAPKGRLASIQVLNYRFDNNAENRATEDKDCAYTTRSDLKILDRVLRSVTITRGHGACVEELLAWLALVQDVDAFVSCSILQLDSTNNIPLLP